MSRKLVYKEIETERLILRYPKIKDYKYQLDFLSDKSNFPFADYKVIKTTAEVEAFFERMTENHLISTLYWVITNKETDEPMGSISAWNIDYEINSIEFGYSIYPNHRGKGYMKEALMAVMDFCVKDNKFSYLDIWTDKANLNSIKLAEALDFKFTGYVTEKAKNHEGDIIYATYRKSYN